MKITGHTTRAVFDRYNITTEADERSASASRAQHVSTLSGAPVVVPMKKAAEGADREK